MAKAEQAVVATNQEELHWPDEDIVRISDQPMLDNDTNHAERLRALARASPKTHVCLVTRMDCVGTTSNARRTCHINEEKD